MTKEEFRKLVMEGMERVLAMPDDLWASGYAMVRLTVGDECVVVGVEEIVKDGEDSDG